MLVPFIDAPHQLVSESAVKIGSFQHHGLQFDRCSDNFNIGAEWQAPRPEIACCKVFPASSLNFHPEPAFT